MLRFALFLSKQHKNSCVPGRVVYNQEHASAQGEREKKLQSEVMQMISSVYLPEAPMSTLTADARIKQKDQELMTNSSKQSSLIISITWVNACNHGSNCSSEEGIFTQSISVSKKKRDKK